MSQTRALQSQRGTLGFALGTKNSDGSCKTTSDYEADLDAIKTHGKPTLVRGYSVSDCDSTRNILPAAQNRGFKVVLGVWPISMTPSPPINWPLRPMRRSIPPKSTLSPWGLRRCTEASSRCRSCWPKSTSKLSFRTSKTARRLRVWRRRRRFIREEFVGCWSGK